MLREGKYEIFTEVEEKIWGPEDAYLTVGVQVFGSDGFKKGDKVKITIEKEE